MFRAARINGYLKAVAELGISAEQLLVDTKIDHESVSDPRYLISLDQYYVVVSNMIKLTRNPGIAFSLDAIGGAS